jgi:hypothetical protein
VTIRRGRTFVHRSELPIDQRPRGQTPPSTPRLRRRSPSRTRDSASRALHSGENCRCRPCVLDGGPSRREGSFSVPG